jgi:hypothetical protein
VHLMAHTLGDIAFLGNKILDHIVLRIPIILVLLVGNIMAEVLSNFHG